jgi:hypothetical protein
MKRKRYKEQQAHNMHMAAGDPLARSEPEPSDLRQDPEGNQHGDERQAAQAHPEMQRPPDAGPLGEHSRGRYSRCSATATGLGMTLTPDRRHVGPRWDALARLP